MRAVKEVSLKRRRRSYHDMFGGHLDLPIVEATVNQFPITYKTSKKIFARGREHDTLSRVLLEREREREANVAG